MSLPVKSRITLPPHGYDPVLRKYTIRGATTIPSEVFDIAEDIEILDASFGRLSSLPENLGDLKNLRIAFFSHNDFEEIPKVLSSCQSLEMVGFKSCKINRLEPNALPAELRGLILTDNLLTRLPESIGDYSQLQKLMLTGNELTSLPEEILRCAKLELLRTSINHFKQSPDWLFQLPKLAWYSDSQNPFSLGRPTTVDSIQEISWNDLEVGDIIGRSAKNVVYRANFEGRSVAVKLFGAGVTTDGAPIDDMYASLLAGDHPSIIGGIAKVYDGPDGREGLLMPLVSQDYKPLGLPPDFTSLTRDVFSDEMQLSLEFVTQVASDIASALEHLSSRGIQHGDVYAHNVLTRHDGKSYIGDFGASSLYKAGTPSGKLRERIDVRGFGYLLDDLIMKNESQTPTYLKDLRAACLTEEVGSRPTFSEINAALAC